MLVVQAVAVAVEAAAAAWVLAAAAAAAAPAAFLCKSKVQLGVELVVLRAVHTSNGGHNLDAAHVKLPKGFDRSSVSNPVVVIVVGFCILKCTYVHF